MKHLIRTIIQHYLRILTKIILWRHRPLIIAIAGTTNKTFCKEMILEELGRGPQVRGNPKSFNTEIGVPLAVLFLPSGYSSFTQWADVLMTGTCISIFSRTFPKVLVLELGVDRKGDMEYLLSMVKPTMAVITTIDKSFPENNTTVDDIVGEMQSLVQAIPADGAVFLNNDDARVRSLASAAKGAVTLYGKRDDSDAKVQQVRPIDTGQAFELQYKGETLSLQTERFGWHNIIAITIAKLVARQLNQMGTYKR